ncbi:MAG TPA: cysteine rich repeat-containing protein [Nitrospiraceae bacterium]|nr:cysteine rich repeat-containing protein [Nitrospiraceae bacterium]
MRLSRTAAMVLVGMISLVGLGGVWGVALLMLPHQDYDTVSMAQSMPGRPAPPDPPLAAVVPPETPVPPASEEELSFTTLPPPDPLPVPTSAGRAVVPRTTMPLNIEIRCDAEIGTACPEGSFEERRQCMQEKLRHMSAPCRQRARDQLVRMKANLHQMRMACAEDARRFCQGAEAGRGPVVQCLEAHAQEVSEACFQALPKRGALLR